MLSSDEATLPWLSRAIEMLPTQRTSLKATALRYGFGLFTLVLAYFSREMVGPPDLGLPLLTFFSAAALTTIIAGIGPGLLTALIGATLGTYLYMPPYNEFSFDFASGNVLSNVVFFIDEIIVCLALLAMRVHFDKYRANRELLKAIVEGTTDAVYVKDLRGNYRFSNNALARSLGRAANEIRGQKDTTLYPEDEARALVDEDHAVIAARNVMNFENRLTTTHGEQRYFLSTKGPLHGEQGEIIGTFGIDRDITQSKQVEETILEKLAMQEQLVKIAELVPGAIISYRRNPDGSNCFPYAGPTLTEIFGCSPAAVRDDASDVLALIHRDDVAAMTSTAKEAKRYGTTWHALFRVAHPRKGEIWVEGSCLPLPQADGSTLWHGYLQDITSKRRAEEQMRLAARVFDMTAEGIVVTDTQNRIVTINSAFATLTGYTREEAVGKTTRLLKPGRHDHGFYADMWQELLTRGKWEGEIWNRRKNGEIFLEWLSINAVKDADNQVVNYVGVFRDITVVKGSQERMEFLATHDEVTNLPNRTLLGDRLRLAISRAERAGSKLALLFVDLDNFKVINDTLGHELGDYLLLQAAARLKECVREQDTVGRMGGDEFVVLLEEADKDIAALSAERILGRLSESYKVDGQECFVSASIGISFYPDDATEHSDLLRHADSAMYRAKEQGKNSYQFFSGEMAERSRNRLNVEGGLRRAIQNRELFLEYQPQINLDTNRLVGAEALIRWRHEGKTVPPLSFIPVAEESSLIIDIGEWVVGEVCRQLHAWDESGAPSFSVSVNISARHFLQTDMVPRIQRIVLDAGIDPSRICLEITEGAMENVNAAMSMLTELKDIGFETSVDDFGTGFSSLSHLKRFPIHELKVDRSFVDGIVGDRDDRAITSAIIAMASSLELRVVAEGVETAEQLRELQTMGCHIGQGYHFSRPLPAERFGEWMRERSCNSQSCNS